MIIFKNFTKKNCFVKHEKNARLKPCPKNNFEKNKSEIGGCRIILLKKKFIQILQHAVMATYAAQK